jgi:hypothetical protein
MTEGLSSSSSPFSGQVLMWGEHVIDLSVSEVEVAKFQRAAILSWSARTARIPFGRYVSNQGVFKISGHMSRFTAPLRGGT